MQGTKKVFTFDKHGEGGRGRLFKIVDFSNFYYPNFGTGNCM
jgi:hypothetical protein